MDVRIFRIFLVLAALFSHLNLHAQLNDDNDYYEPEEALSRIEDTVTENITVVYVDAFGVYSNVYRAVMPLVRDVLDRIQSEIPFEDLRIYVIPTRKLVIPEIGIGGKSKGPNTVILYFDPTHPDYPNTLTNNFPRVIAHEVFHSLHHRRRDNDKTLLSHMVSEGLAQRFAMDLLDLPPRLWNAAFSASQVSEIMLLACEELDSTEWSQLLWFSGRRNLTNNDLGNRAELVPKWAGYTVGLYLVDEYIKKNPEATFSQLLPVPATEFKAGAKCK